MKYILNVYGIVYSLLIFTYPVPHHHGTHTHTPHTPHPTQFPHIPCMKYTNSIRKRYVTNEWYVLFPSHRYSNCGSCRLKSCLVRTSYQITDQEHARAFIFVKSVSFLELSWNWSRKTLTIYRRHVCWTNQPWRWWKCPLWAREIHSPGLK